MTKKYKTMRQISCYSMFLVLTLVLASCSKDDGPEIRKALAQCQIATKTEGQEYSDTNTRFSLIVSASAKITCMQAKGFKFMSENPSCEWDIKSDAVLYEMITNRADCYRADG